MRPPFCNWRVDEGARVNANGHTMSDPLAMALPCHCASGHFKDFAARLERFNPELKLGFLLDENCYAVYRDLPRIETLDCGGFKLKAVTRRPLIIKPCQWVVIRKVRGGNKFIHSPRDPGDWLLRDLGEYAPGQFELDGSWVGPTADRMAKTADAANKAKMKKLAGDVWDDVYSSADKGDPTKFRTSVAVSK